MAQARRRLALATLTDRNRRTRELIEQGGLVEKAKLVDAIGERDGELDVEALLGCLLEAADKAREDRGLVTIWRDRGRAAFEADRQKKKAPGDPRATGAKS